MTPLVHILATAWLSSVASAAEVTDIAPRLGMLAGLSYDGFALNGGLIEGDERVSGRRVSRHDIDLLAEFAPARGIAVTLDVEITPSLVYAFPDARGMVIEPLDGSGSYLAGEPSPEMPSVRGSGVSGVWFGAALAPFAETTGVSSRSTWRLDLAFRTPSPKSNIWTAPNGKRGAANGGSALRLVGGFSVDRGVGNPYLQAKWVRESAVKVDITDESGTLWAQELELKPADEFGLRGGIEVVGYEDTDLQSRFAVDVFFGAGYRSWEDVASGVYLPNVLDGARSIPVTAGDQLKGTTGVALDYHVNEYVRTRTGLEFVYHTPFNPEHVYNVTTTADTWMLGWFVKVQGVPVFDGG